MAQFNGLSCEAVANLEDVITIKTTWAKYIRYRISQFASNYVKYALNL